VRFASSLVRRGLNEFAPPGQLNQEWMRTIAENTGEDANDFKKEIGTTWSVLMQ
jgi:hypothetical protein